MRNYELLSHSTAVFKKGDVGLKIEYKFEYDKGFIRPFY